MTGTHKICVTCGVPVRPYGTTKEDYPGTVRHGRRGQCANCRTRELQAERMKPCALCDVQMRPKGSLLSDWPGTNSHAARGVCTVCNDKQRRAAARAKAGTPAPETKQVQYLREEIEFLLETGDTKESLYRNTEIARMAIEYVFKALKIVE